MTKPIHKRIIPTLPTTVKVGYRDVSIEWATLEVLDDANGDYLDSKQRIRIGDFLKPQKAAEVVIHELLHACWPNRWSLVGDVEETFVSGLAPMLAQVWRDNPDLVDWISYNLLGE